MSRKGALFIPAILIAVFLLLAAGGGYYVLKNREQKVSADALEITPEMVEREKQRRDRDTIQTQLFQIAPALVKYYGDHKGYPSTPNDLLNKDGDIEVSDNGIIILGSDERQKEFFKNISYAVSDDAQHFVLSAKLESTKDSLGFAKIGRYAPVNKVAYGINCGDPHLYCITDTYFAKTSLTSDQIRNLPRIAVEVNTTNWKTYRNAKYGFTFKYPPDFSTPEENTDSVPSGDVYLYNYRYEFYPAESFVRYANFSLSLVPDVGTPGITAEEVVIDSVVYAKVQVNKDRRETRFFLERPNGKFLQIIYRPIVDTKDIGALASRPDYVAGVEAVKRNPNFLNYESQLKILNAILASVKLF